MDTFSTGQTDTQEPMQDFWSGKIRAHIQTEQILQYLLPKSKTFFGEFSPLSNWGHPYFDTDKFNVFRRFHKQARHGSRRKQWLVEIFTSRCKGERKKVCFLFKLELSRNRTFLQFGCSYDACKVVDESAPDMQGILTKNGDALVQVSCIVSMCMFRVATNEMAFCKSCTLFVF